MKRIMLPSVLCGMMTTANADWIYGAAYFSGCQPSNSLNHEGVIIWYNGPLPQTSLNGGVEIWERLRVDELCSGMGTGETCMVYHKDYKGPQMRFMPKSGSIHIQSLR